MVQGYWKGNREEEIEDTDSMRIPQSAAQDVQQAIRDIYAQLDKLNNKDIDLSGRRVVNAGKSVSQMDYVTRLELDEKTGQVTVVKQNVTKTSPLSQNAHVYMNTSVSPVKVTDAGLLSYETDTGLLYLSTGTALEVLNSNARIDTFANRGTAGSHKLKFFSASDWNYVLWLSDGSNWLYITGTYVGTMAPDQRPTASLTAYDVGLLFRASDTLEIYRWSGSAWAQYIERIDSPTFAVDSGNHRVGVGTVAPAAKLDVLSTTEQLRLSYDSSHVATFVVSSTGAMTVTPQSGTNLNLNMANTGDLAVSTDKLYVDTSESMVGINNAYPSSALDVIGDVEVGSVNCVYFGNPTTDGSWRIGRSGNDLLVERRESGNYVVKGTFIP
jgi:hypothetical protein